LFGKTHDRANTELFLLEINIYGIILLSYFYLLILYFINFMLCPSCNKQIPDNASRCSYCDQVIDHVEQVPIEIGHRRKQRWGFYVLIILLFLVSIGGILYVMNKNSKLLLDIANVRGDLEIVEGDMEIKERELENAQKELNKKMAQIKTIENNLSQKVGELESETNKFKDLFDEKNVIDEKYKECNFGLDSSEANIYNLIVKLGVGMTDANLSRILIADVNLDSMDTDNDGLSDIVEDLINTDPLKPDTDNDGYSDLDEVLKGFNPAGDGGMGIDQDFADRQKGKILLQIEQGGEAWYVSMSDGKRYFLGRPIDGFKIMRNLDYWNKIKKTAE